MQILSDSHGAAVTSAASGPSAQKVGFPERSDIRKLYLSWSLPPCSSTAELYWVFKTLDSQIQLTSQCGTAMNTDLESIYWLMFMICTFCDSQLKPQTLHEAFLRLLVKALIFSGTSHVRSTADRNREHDGKLVADILLSLPLIRCSRALWEVIPPLIPAHSHITRLGHVACLANEMGANASDALPTPQRRTFKSHWVCLSSVLARLWALRMCVQTESAACAETLKWRHTGRNRSWDSCQSPPTEWVRTKTSAFSSGCSLHSITWGKLTNTVTKQEVSMIEVVSYWNAFMCICIIQIVISYELPCFLIILYAHV